MEKYINVTCKKALPFLEPKDFTTMMFEVVEATDLLNSREGKGSDFLGWEDLPVTYDKEDDMIDYKRLREIKRACKDNDKLKARFKIAMQTLAHNNEIDKDGAEVDSYSGLVDGLSL